VSKSVVTVEEVTSNVVTIKVSEETARKLNYALESVEDFLEHRDLVDLSVALDAEGFQAQSTEVAEVEDVESGGCGCGTEDDETGELI
jgi:hypothetical protein